MPGEANADSEGFSVQGLGFRAGAVSCALPLCPSGIRRETKRFRV